MANENSGQYLLRFKKAVHSFIKELKTDPGRPAYSGDKYHCPVCNTDIAYFKPMYDLFEIWDKHQFAYSAFAFETINYFKYECPKCGAPDRERLYVLYFNKKFPVAPAGKLNLLEIAPSGLDGIKSRPYINYRNADLYRPGVDDVVDIQDMHIYEDGKFDIFICSHVLEHVPSDKKAISELYRITKPGGWGIAMVPVNLAIEETVEDETITSESDRWKYFAQNDHVRMYSKKGFVTALEGGGFKVKQYGIDYFGADTFEKCGIHPRSVLYIAEK